MHAIGVDTSKRTFHAAFDAGAVQILENSAPGIMRFFDLLNARGIPREDATIGVEVTGANHLLLCMRGA